LTADQAVASSFRDPSGFLFRRAGELHRQVNLEYKAHYDHLMHSGLYQELIDADLLIPHQEVYIDHPEPSNHYKLIKPEVIPFISYPYEWCFSQLKNAALATLEIQKWAIKHEMVLKDSSAYNIQFRKGKPVLIDTLSFEKYQEGKPWAAYRQFCQHFLAPLALMSHKDIRLDQLLRIYIDGVPLDLASSLLPLRTRFIPSLLLHIHLHAKSQSYYSDKVVKTGSQKISRLSFLGLRDNLETAVKNMKWRPGKTEWGAYYADTNYSDPAINHKKQIIEDFVKEAQPSQVWDLGGNTGLFSRIASDQGIETISFDSDPIAIEKSYEQCCTDQERHILPLLVDLANPTPAIGWDNSERMSFDQRGPTDMVMALALIHHLAISNNLPLNRIAGFFGKLCSSLIIEFVPKEDSQVQRLLSTREDIFPEYTQSNFEQMFLEYFMISNSIKIKDSKRTLYLMRKR